MKGLVIYLILEETKDGANVLIQCDQCGEQHLRNYKMSLKTKNQFCDKKCADNFSSGKSKDKTEVKTNCYTCGEEIITEPYILKSSKRMFCCKECQIKWQKSDEYKEIYKNKQCKRAEIITKQCNYCGEYVTRKSHEFRGELCFCSNQCNMKYVNPNPEKDKIEVLCDNCGKPKLVHESRFGNNKYHFCDLKCYHEFRSKELNGDKIHNYQGLTTNCSLCDKEIPTTQYFQELNQHNYCSQKCYWQHKKILLKGQKPAWFYTLTDEQRAEISRKNAINNLKNGKYPQCFSKPHQLISNVLDVLEIKHENEFPMNYYVCDIFIPNHNKIIEINGDWFHANPLIYNREALHNIQKKTITRDKRKNTYIKKYKEIDILYIWEYDIKNNIDVCKELIRQYVYDDKIEDYHSFNYELINNDLKLKNKITKAFFNAS